MIMVVISDIEGLQTIDEEILKKVTGAHDLLFINIDDASMFGNDIYDLDSKSDLPKFITKHKDLMTIEKNAKQQIIDSNFKRLEKYRVTGTTISSKKEVVSKLIDLLERHNHAVGR
jgi:vesicle coat complex subunit